MSHTSAPQSPARPQAQTQAQTENRATAALFMLLASACIAGSTLCAKLVQSEALGPGLPPHMATAGRFVFAFLGVAVVSAMVRPRIGRPHWRLHILRTTMGGIGVTLMFAAVASIPLADATAISFLNPVFAMLLAVVILGERVGPWRWRAAAISLAGAMILLRPGDGVLQLGALFALGAAMILGAEITVIKRLSSLESPLAILFVNNALGSMAFGAIALVYWQGPTADQWFALAGVGFAMGSAQAFYINGLRRADASFAVPFTYAVLVFAALLDLVIFGVMPDAVSFLGIATILAGAALLAWREGRAAQGR